MDNEKLSQKIDKLDERLDSIDKTLIKQEGQLALHIRRTEIAEENIKMLRDDLKPIKKHVNMIEGIIKFLGILVTIGSVLKVFGLI